MGHSGTSVKRNPRKTYQMKPNQTKNKKTTNKQKERPRNHILLVPKADLFCYSYPPCCQESFVIPLLGACVNLKLHASISRLRSVSIKRLIYDNMKIKYIWTQREQELSYRCPYPIFKTKRNKPLYNLLKDQTFIFLFY